MSRAGRDGGDLAGLDELIEEITVDASGADEQLWAFRQAFEDDVPLPADGFVVGEPVSVIAIGFAGDERPSDNQGVRCLMGEVRAARAWEARRDDR